MNATDTLEFLPRREPISGAFFEGRYTWVDYQVNYRFGPQRWQGNLGVQWGGFYQSGSPSPSGTAVESILNFRSSRAWSSTSSTCHSRRTPEYNQHVARTRMTYTMTRRAHERARRQHREQDRQRKLPAAVGVGARSELFVAH